MLLSDRLALPGAAVDDPGRRALYRVAGEGTLLCSFASTAGALLSFSAGPHKCARSGAAQLSASWRDRGGVRRDALLYLLSLRLVRCFRSSDPSGDGSDAMRALPYTLTKARFGIA